MALWNLFGRSRRSPVAAQQDWISTSLTGRYEVRVDRIVGTLRDAYEPDVASMRVDFLRRGHVVASCPATWNAEHRRYDFAMAIDGRFTPLDLVKEEIVVIARDSDGKRGRVMLDGAAQLEMVREHMAVPSVLLLDLDFSRDGNAKPLLGAGWSGAEENFTWTEGDESIIQIDTPQEPGIYALRLTASPHIRRVELPQQELTVLVNESAVGVVIYTASYTQFHEFKFRHDVFDTAPHTTVRLHHPLAARPSDFGLPDKRRLAIAVKRLTLARMLEESDDV